MVDYEVHILHIDRWKCQIAYVSPVFIFLNDFYLWAQLDESNPSERATEGIALTIKRSIVHLMITGAGWMRTDQLGY